MMLLKPDSCAQRHRRGWWYRRRITVHFQAAPRKSHQLCVRGEPNLTFFIIFRNASDVWNVGQASLPVHGRRGFKNLACDPVCGSCGWFSRSLETRRGCRVYVFQRHRNTLFLRPLRWI